MNYNPLVSIILPAYNAQETIEEAINSIIQQTYKNWELIVINDGSQDNTDSIVKSFKDPRIKYYVNDGNKKLIYTLNRGLDLAAGKYIARMDADDISLPMRLEKQVNFLEKNPDYVILGGQITCFGKKGVIPMRVSLTDQELRQELLWHNPFAHPTVMMRTSTIKSNSIYYSVDYMHAEDYKMWTDIARYGLLANLNEVVLRYRLSSSQVSQSSVKGMIETTRRIQKEVRTEYDAVIPFSLESNLDLESLKNATQYFANIGLEKDWVLVELLYIYLSNSNNLSKILFYLSKIGIFNKLSFHVFVKIFLDAAGLNKWNYLKY